MCNPRRCSSLTMMACSVLNSSMLRWPEQSVSTILKRVSGVYLCASSTIGLSLCIEPGLRPSGRGAGRHSEADTVRGGRGKECAPVAVLAAVVKLHDDVALLVTVDGALAVLLVIEAQADLEGLGAPAGPRADGSPSVGAAIGGRRRRWASGHWKGWVSGGGRASGGGSRGTAGFERRREMAHSFMSSVGPELWLLENAPPIVAEFVDCLLSAEGKGEIRPVAVAAAGSCAAWCVRLCCRAPSGAPGLGAALQTMRTRHDPLALPAHFSSLRRAILRSERGCRSAGGIRARGRAASRGSHPTCPEAKVHWAIHTRAW